MNYQLVLQFAGKSIDDFDRLVELETELEDSLSAIADVDGHDFGNGQMNIFILTENPIEAFDRAKTIVAERIGDLSCLKAAYRDIQTELFIVIWPSESADFEVT